MDRSVAPQTVSPLIKVFSTSAPGLTKSFILGINQIPIIQIFPYGARWSLLIAGIIYGTARYKRLYHIEQVKKAELERTRPEREAKLKAKKEREMKEQLEQLSKDLGQQI